MAEEKQRLIKGLSAALPAIGFEASEALAGGGFADSPAVVSVAGIPSMEYGIGIPDGELEGISFNSVYEMLELVERRRGGA